MHSFKLRFEFWPFCAHMCIIKLSLGLLSVLAGDHAYSFLICDIFCGACSQWEESASIMRKGKNLVIANAIIPYIDCNCIVHSSAIYYQNLNVVREYTCSLNVCQIYGFFFPRDMVMSHFINLFLTIVFQYLESTLHTLVSATWQTSDKLSGTTFVRIVCIKWVNMSIGKKL